MIDHETCLAILEKINVEIVFVDTNHIIRYMNEAAKKNYYEKLNYSDLVGKPIFGCHNRESQEKIRNVYSRLQMGEDQVYMPVDGIKRYSVVAVRNEKGDLLGYYERFEKVESVEKGNSAP